MRFRTLPALCTLCVTGAVVATPQDPIEEVERVLRERAALRLAVNDTAGAIELAQTSAKAAGIHEKFSGTLLLAELYFCSGRRAEAFRITSAWRAEWNPIVPAGTLGPGDLIEVLDPELRILELAIIGADASLWHLGERRAAKVGLQDPTRLDAATSAALRAHYGEGVKLRAWRTEKEVLGVPPQAAPPAQEDARTKEVREHFQKLNLPRLGDQDHSRMDALRRMGPAAIESAVALWLAADERDPVRVNAALFVAQEAPQRLREILPSLRESQRSAAASALLHGMGQSDGIPPALLREEFREGWLGLLDAPDGSVRSSALFLVDRAYPEAVAARLERLAADPDALLRQRVAQQLLPRLAWDDRIEGVARGMLRDGDAEVRQHVVRLLGERRVLRAADALAVLREDASVDVRGMILRQGFPLAGTREEVEQVLLQGLQDANAQVSLFALDQLSKGVCSPISNPELVAQLSRFAMQSDERYSVQALNALEHLAPDVLGPVLEDLIRTVSPRTLMRANPLRAWAGRSEGPLATATLRPSIWLERRPWFLREQGAAQVFDSFLQRHVVQHIAEAEVAAWLPLAHERNPLSAAILERAARIAPQTLESVVRDSKTESWLVRHVIGALGEDARAIAWAAADPRWRDDSGVMEALGRHAEREDARALVSAWLERHLSPDLAAVRSRVLDDWIPKQDRPEDNLPLLPIFSRALWHSTDAHRVDASVLARVPLERVIEALDSTRPAQPDEGAWSRVFKYVAPRAGRSSAAQDLWVRWFAPRCLQSAAMGAAFRLDPSLLKSASPQLAELYLAWSKSDTPRIRSQACRFFGRDLVPGARAHLIAALRDPALEVSTVAAYELQNFEDSASVDALLEASTAEDPSLREAARKSLEALRGRIEAKRFWSTVRAEGTEDPLAKILPLVRDPDAEVRLLAIDSLGALGSPRALPQLLELFKSGAGAEKAAARRAIERIQSAVDAERAKAVESGAKPAPGGEKKGDETPKQGETEGGGGDS